MTQRPSGSWTSALTAQNVASQGVRLGEVQTHGQSTFWLERRPDEGGRSVVVEYSPREAARDRTPSGSNARSRVHEYGGGSYTVHDGDVLFVDFVEQTLVRTTSAGGTEDLCQTDGTSLADLEVDAARERVVCIAEVARDGQEPAARIVAVPLRGGSPKTLAEGHDFFSSPRISPDGSHLAFLTWEHPQMPWDGTILWLAKFDREGELQEPRRIAGGQSESIFQPSWSPDGVLHWVSDRTGYWNLERLGNNRHPVCPRAAEFGLPHWVFRMSTYAIPSPDVIATAFQEDGIWSFGTIRGGQLQALDLGVSWIDSVSGSEDRAVMIGGSPSTAPQILEVNLDNGRWSCLKGASENVDPDAVSHGVPFRFDTTEGDEAHAFLYEPRGGSLPQGERPVTLVKSHGGPTAASGNAYDPAVQYWTSRGIAVVDVNYRGSTGYGRAYRDRLQGNWGIYDVDDCEAAAAHLTREGTIDGDRLAIRGGSAGGYTTLCALAFRSTFRAGASHYGVGDLETLARDTHKFESRYLDGMIGPYPERKDLYQERSPIHFTDQLDCPAIFFQGSDDKIVPPNQAEAMVGALDAKGLAVAYLLFDGEGHGFRRAENIVRALEAELYFYSRVFGFEAADALPVVKIRNLQSPDNCSS